MELQNLKITQEEIDQFVTEKSVKNLEELDFYNCEGFETINVSELLNLNSLSLGLSKIKEIQGLDKLTGLKNLSLRHMDQLNDFSKIKNLEQLEKLDLYETNIDSIEPVKDLKNIKEIKNVQLIIKDGNQKTVYQHTLKLKQVEKLSCSSKTFKVENACISNDFMRLGYLTSTDEDLLKKYPNISLEYRYLKSNKLNDKNDKNYVVFKKINGKTKEIVNQKIYQTYNHDLNQGSLKKKKLSVVIILSKDQSQKSYVFKLNFSKENGGLYE